MLRVLANNMEPRGGGYGGVLTVEARQILVMVAERWQTSTSYIRSTPRDYFVEAADFYTNTSNHYAVIDTPLQVLWFKE